MFQGPVYGLLYGPRSLVQQRGELFKWLVEAEGKGRVQFALHFPELSQQVFLLLAGGCRFCIRAVSSVLASLPPSARGVGLLLVAVMVVGLLAVVVVLSPESGRGGWLVCWNMALVSGSVEWCYVWCSSELGHSRSDSDMGVGGGGRRGADAVTPAASVSGRSVLAHQLARWCSRAGSGRCSVSRGGVGPVSAALFAALWSVPGGLCWARGGCCLAAVPGCLLAGGAFAVGLRRAVATSGGGCVGGALVAGFVLGVVWSVWVAAGGTPPPLPGHGRGIRRWGSVGTVRLRLQHLLWVRLLWQLRCSRLTVPSLGLLGGLCTSPWVGRRSWLLVILGTVGSWWLRLLCLCLLLLAVGGERPELAGLVVLWHWWICPGLLHV